MSLHLPKRVSRPHHSHPLSHGDGLPQVLKVVLALSILPVALFVAVVLSIRAELAPDRLAERPLPLDICGPSLELPGGPAGFDDVKHQFCLD